MRTLQTREFDYASDPRARPPAIRARSCDKPTLLRQFARRRGETAGNQLLASW